MFGGVGLYSDGVFFGIIARDALYLKVDGHTRAAYERAGMLPFTPFPGRRTAMGYYGVPVEVLESGMELTRWARDAGAREYRVPLFLPVRELERLGYFRSFPQQATFPAALDVA